MTQEDAFLQAITESPEDDTPRLIYADWLEDRADPRGEFIRVQCQLATLASADPQRPPLEQHELWLLERHQDEWLGSLRPLLSHWTFRRGFLDAISVPAVAYLRHTPFPHPATVRRIEVDLEGFAVPADTLELVPESVAFENALLPIGFRGRTLVVVVQDPLDTKTKETMEFIFNRDIEVVAAPDRQVAKAIRRHYGSPVPAEEEPNLSGCFVSTTAFPPDEVDLGSWDNRSPAARLLARLLAEAIGLNASEVRIEPGPESIRVRYFGARGIVAGEVTPVHLLWPVVTRLRIMAGIWVDDQRDMQGGAIRLTVRHRRIEVEVVIRRTNGGPAVVLTFQPGR